VVRPMPVLGREHVLDRGSDADIESAQTLTADVFCSSQVASSLYDVVQLRTVLIVTPICSN
jgi:hypothetical protein